MSEGATAVLQRPDLIMLTSALARGAPRSADGSRYVECVIEQWHPNLSPTLEFSSVSSCGVDRAVRDRERGTAADDCSTYTGLHHVQTGAAVSEDKVDEPVGSVGLQSRPLRLVVDRSILDEQLLGRRPHPVGGQTLIRG